MLRTLDRSSDLRFPTHGRAERYVCRLVCNRASELIAGSQPNRRKCNSGSPGPHDILHSLAMMRPSPYDSQLEEAAVEFLKNLKAAPTLPKSLRALQNVPPIPAQF